MKTTMIRLKNVSEAQEFVEAAGKCDYEIDVKYNRIVVDAKSLLGVLSICNNPFMVCESGSDENFTKLLERFSVDKAE